MFHVSSMLNALAPIALVATVAGATATVGGDPNADTYGDLQPAQTVPGPTSAPPPIPTPPPTLPGPSAPPNPPQRPPIR